MSTQRKYVHYPEPQEGPDTPYDGKRKSNPPLRGLALVAAASLMEWFGPLRSLIWHNAGFGSLRSIRRHIEDVEPRYDPTVVPLHHNHDQQSGSGQASQPIKSNPGIVPSGYYSVADYHELYLSGEISPVAVARILLPLIRRDTSPPGEHSIAWFETKVEEVMGAARASARRYKEGKALGILDGVPVTVKDDYDIHGYKTTLGSKNDYTTIPKDGTSTTNWCVRQLEQSGAIILGKASMHEFGLDTTGNNPVFGTPTNPYNPSYYPGGSSSGSAYAVAVGLVPIALGSDGGGSIRIPASFCGVFGLKPSHGRLSFRPSANHSITCAVNGPIACDLTSLSALFEVVSEPHPTSPFTKLPAAPSLRRSDQNQKKLLGIPEKWFAAAAPGVQTLCRTLIAKLVSEKGYTIIPIDIPFLNEGQTAHALTMLTDGATLLPETKNLTPANRILLAIGRTTPATDYLLAQKLRGLLMAHLAHLWQAYPGMIMVTPTSACAGWKIKSRSELVHGLSDGDMTITSMRYVWLANFCGVPALTVPAGYVVPEGEVDAGTVADGKTEGKVPVGLMATAEWTHEDGLLRFGADAEEVGAARRHKPGNWVDVVGRAREVMKERQEEGLWGA